MRKKSLLFFLLFIALTGKVWAQGGYGVFVAEVPVTPDNASNVTSPYITSGTVSYDASSSTLTLDNVTMNLTAVDSCGITNYNPLRINLVGDNNITTLYKGIMAYGSLYLEGDGNLTLTSVNYEGICAYDNLTARGNGVVTVSTQGIDVAAVSGNEGNEGNTIDISACHTFIADKPVKANRSTNDDIHPDYDVSAIFGFDEFVNMNSYTGDYCLMVVPYYAFYDAVTRQFMATLVDCYPGRLVFTKEHYDLKVGRFWVNRFTADDIMGNGKVSYNDATHTLTIKANTSINDANSDGDGIYNNIAGLRIVVEEGTSFINVSEGSGIYSPVDLIIEGAGMLQVSGTDAIWVLDNLTIKNCTLWPYVTLEGAGNGSAIRGTNTSHLTLYNAELNIHTIEHSYSAIYGFGDVTLNSCSVTSPTGAAWNNTQHCFTVDDTPVYDMTIGRGPYDLWLGGVRVTAENASNITGGNITAGRANYNAAHNYLNLVGVNAHSESGNALLNRIPGLTIYLTGVNDLHSDSQCGILSEADLVIEGPGHLLVDGVDGIRMVSSDLTLQGGCVVFALGNGSGNSGGLNCVGDDAGNLTIDQAIVTARAPESTYGSIHGFDVFTLTGSVIEAPANAQWNPYNHCIAIDGEPVNGQVSIVMDDDNVFRGTVDQAWENADNWSRHEVPTDGDVVINAPCLISSEVTVNSIVANNPTYLTIGPEGRLNYNDDGLVATIQKNIRAFTPDAEPADGWHFIATPVAAGSDLEAVQIGTYDLYRFNDGAELEWENVMQQDNGFTALDHGRGYLYANAADQTLSFAGTMNAKQGNVTLHVNGDGPLAGWNLVGNPFTCDAYVDGQFYVCNPAGNGIVTGSNPISPCTGIMVIADADGQTLSFSKTAPITNQQATQLLMEVTEATRGAALMDNARINFGDESQLEKFYFNQNSCLYIPQDGKDYAVVNANAEGTLPLCFKAPKDGQYTLSFANANEVTDYLHLIDNLTDNDVDLLVTDSYTFSARATDYASRFKLVFAPKAVDEEGSTPTSFAYITDGQLLILNEGDATLQVIDVMGRVVRNQSISGDFRMSTGEMAAGVYVINLDGKTQKIVIR